MKRPRHLKTLVVVALAVLWIAAAICFWHLSRFELSAEEVTKMTAELSNRPNRGPKIDRFEVPDSFHEEVVDFLDGALPHRSQIDWAILGELEITTNSSVRGVLLFSAADELVFDARPGGKYESDSLMEFIRTVEAAKKAQVEE